MRDRFVAGDPIRGGAALIIFTFHVALASLFITGFEFGRDDQRDAFGPFLPLILDNAELVVYAFFVLSGYLIGRPFVQAFLGYRPPPRLGKYGRRRFMRIMPAFWIVVTLAVIRFGTLDSSTLDVVGIYALMQSYDVAAGPLVQGVLGQLWTVHVEAWFYALLPLGAIGLTFACGRRLSRNGRIVALFALLLLVALASLAIRQALPHNIPHLRWASALMFGFVPGVALAALETFVPRHATGRAWTGWATVGLVVVGVLFCLAFNEWYLRSPAITGALAALGTTAFVAAALLHQWSGRRLSRLFDNRPVNWLGERSYSFYLLHVPILWEMQLRFDGTVTTPWAAFGLLFGCTFVLSALGATVGYRYVERPSMGLDPWFWERKQSLPVEAAPAEPAPALAPKR
ncbi:MAG: acyltransferase [Thermoleophilaceae bacterium]